MKVILNKEDQLIFEQRKTKELNNRLNKVLADLEYFAMMQETDLTTSTNFSQEQNESGDI